MGELEIRGPWVAASYYDTPEQADRWTDDGWFKTGDIVSMHPRGFVMIKDRSKDVIKSGGEWISSVELENALMAHPAVAEAAVIAIPDEKWSERPLAAVVLKEGATATADELREFLAPNFAKWWLPDRFEFIAEIPKTAVGKFRKTALREQFAQDPVATTRDVPQRARHRRALGNRRGDRLGARARRRGRARARPRRRLRRLGPARVGRRSARSTSRVSTPASSTREADVTRIDDEQYRRILGANVDGVVFGVRRLAQVMERGSIVVTASLAGLTATEPDPLYALTKHAVVGFVRSAAPQLAARGIRLNMVNPGFVDTPMLDEVGRAAFEAAGFPLLRPEDVAAAVLRAADDDEVGPGVDRAAGPRADEVPLPEPPGPARRGQGRDPAAAVTAEAHRRGRTSSRQSRTSGTRSATGG